jgi:cell division septation protein DedD
MRILTLIISFVLLPAFANAQATGGTTSRATPDSVFARALGLNNEQRGVEARALLDSLLRATPATNSSYADALFWSAVLSETEGAAEAAYNRIVREFPLHRRAEESLIRLAQLEMARGNRSQAQRHLDRIIVEHPYGQYRAKASYWRARLFFEENELERGCAELGMARSRLPAADIELKTEIDYAARRCAVVPTPTTTAAQKAAAAAAQKNADAAAQKNAASGAQKTADAGTGQKAGKAAPPSTTKTPPTSAAKSAAASKAAPPTELFSAQAAAFPLKANATAFQEVLKGRGYDARVVGSASPYRVRIGWFASREDAVALVAELKLKGISDGAFVVTAEPR